MYYDTDHKMRHTPFHFEITRFIDMIPHSNPQDQYQRPRFFIPSAQEHYSQQNHHSPPNIKSTFLNPMPQPTADIHTTLQQTMATASWVLGQQAFMQPQQQAIVSKWISWPIMTLRPYFQVTNSYVLKKIGIMIFPFRHTTWQRIQTTISPTNTSSLAMPGSIAVYSSGNDGGLTCVPVLYALPKEDINAPDLYIPFMAFVTYVILVGIISGMGGKFKPDMLGLTASSALIFSFLELLIIKLGCYLLSFGNELAFLDVMSYVGYKYIG